MINFTEHGKTTSGETLFAKVDENGKITMTCTSDNPEYVAFLTQLENEGI
jgi:hypothetical protein